MITRIVKLKISLMVILPMEANYLLKIISNKHANAAVDLFSKTKTKKKYICKFIGVSEFP